jgi:hypothetical protein
MAIKMKKVLSCIFVFVIFVSVMHVAVFAINSYSTKVSSNEPFLEIYQKKNRLIKRLQNIGTQER